MAKIPLSKWAGGGSADITIHDAMVDEDKSHGYGVDYYELTQEHLDALRAGKVLAFSAQAEYEVFVALAQEKA